MARLPYKVGDFISQCDHNMIIVAYDHMICGNSNLIEPRWNMMEVMKLLLIIYFLLVHMHQMGIKPM